MRRRRSLATGLVAALLALLGIVIAIAEGVITAGLPRSVTGDLPLWIGVAIGVSAVIAALTRLRQWLVGRPPGAVLGQVPLVAGWVDRAELAQVVAVLTAGGAVALTTGLSGAGGFGKTTLAARACQDRMVRRQFRVGICWVTVGREVNDEALAARISERVRDLGGEGTFSRLEEAGKALGAALSGRGRVPLVADDVWTASQLEPFKVAGQHGGLLVTTRRPVILDALSTRRIAVDAVPLVVARRMLTAGLPPIGARMEEELLRLAGGWPLMLNLIRRRLALDLSRPGGTIAAAAADAVARLRRAGPAALDIADAGSRQLAVGATVDYSLDAVAAADRDRFYELSVFAEDAEIPVAAAALLWQGIAGLVEEAARGLCSGWTGCRWCRWPLPGTRG